jgi:hypothetical protein
VPALNKATSTVSKAKLGGKYLQKDIIHLSDNYFSSWICGFFLRKQHDEPQLYEYRTLFWKGKWRAKRWDMWDMQEALHEHRERTLHADEGFFLVHPPAPTMHPAMTTSTGLRFWKQATAKFSVPSHFHEGVEIVLFPCFLQLLYAKIEE